MEVLLCSGYLAIGVVLSGLLVRFNLADKENDDYQRAALLFISVMWPIFIALSILLCVFWVLHKIIMKIGGK